MDFEGDLLVKAEDYNKTSLLLSFNSGEQRVLDLNRLFAIVGDPHLSDAIKKRWKIMYDKGDFFNYEVCEGYLVFPGWVEIFKEDLKSQTVKLEMYQYYEKMKKLFVHFGADHFEISEFTLARNSEGFKSKPIGGLWGSPVDAKLSWQQWCIDNNYRKADLERCFYFRLETPCNWITIHNKKEWESLPKREEIHNQFKAIDFNKVRDNGDDDRYPLYAIEIAFEDYEEFFDCFPGYDCDSVIVLDDKILVENYDAKYSENPLMLNDLLPIHFFKEIRENVLVSCLLRSPDDKTYIYIEEPDIHYGFKTLVACISDGRIVEIGGFTEKEALMLIEEVTPFQQELEEILKEKRVLMVR